MIRLIQETGSHFIEGGLCQACLMAGEFCSRPHLALSQLVVASSSESCLKFIIHTFLPIQTDYCYKF